MATGTTMMNDSRTHWHVATWATTNEGPSISSRENIPRNATPGPSNVCRTLSPESTVMDRDVQAEPADPWSGMENAQIWPDPEYPTGTWNPGDIPELYRHWDQPMDPTIYDIPGIPDAPQEPDPTPPYFVAGATWIPRARPSDEPRLLWQRQHPKLGESLGN
ncbi:hypothetical protein ARMGADRAFT_1071374 [Armillaria gallica]|uniref:Uncharacterized protein n=1 Tax=Armillaria gallica TaxID=47427 RepID=A0A2H3EG10_ARMGA|nr:hypothetical protein ARMGADRAFT_1071374 [Armillaria gallica]